MVLFFCFKAHQLHHLGCVLGFFLQLNFNSIKMSLGEDMLMGILARLPAKSLHRFKCVSTEWQNLISTGSLSRKILPPLMSGLFYQSKEHSGQAFMPNSMVANGVDMDMSLNFLPCHHKLRVANCCNGLLLCWVKGKHWDQRSYFLHYIVCNPTTKKWVTLPEVYKIDCPVGLVYDPQISDQFKVARFLHCRPNDLFIKLQIYSSETGKWVEAKVVLAFKVHFSEDRQVVYSNGALHVLCNPHHVLKFDAKEESCELIELPRDVIGHLGESDGCLHYVNLDTFIIEIWKLNDCASREWVLEVKIRMQDLIQQLPQPHSDMFYFLAFHPDLEVIFLEMKGTIYSYHLNSSNLKKFGTVTMDISSGLVLFSYPFSPCLDTFAH
ncbi:F-box protein At5g49610-like isoform X2 [Tasmannia lanceolata]|uniref:F-box protein At5g49610-like isoform X2 n=1 Tax=Tasmannia lanceolata TaxID=3420 RepID=UPI004062A557